MTNPIVAPSTAPKPITTKQLDALTKVWDLNMNKSGSIKNKDFKDWSTRLWCCSTHCG